MQVFVEIHTETLSYGALAVVWVACWLWYRNRSKASGDAGFSWFDSDGCGGDGGD